MLEIFAKSKTPRSQKALAAAIARRGRPATDRVSIYRNLNQFVRASLIHEIATNLYVYCDHLAAAPHPAHLILFCQRCTRHEEVCGPLAFERVVDRLEFFGPGGSRQISGLCRRCAPR